VFHCWWYDPLEMLKRLTILEKADGDSFAGTFGSSLNGEHTVTVRRILVRTEEDEIVNVLKVDTGLQNGV